MQWMMSIFERQEIYEMSITIVPYHCLGGFSGHRGWRQVKMDRFSELRIQEELVAILQDRVLLERRELHRDGALDI